MESTEMAVAVFVAKIFVSQNDIILLYSKCIINYFTYNKTLLFIGNYSIPDLTKQ